MSGGKGGSQTQAVEIPKWIEEPATRNLARAEAAQQIGYMPYFGPDLAAFNPTQTAAMQADIGAAQAFGLVPEGMTALQGMPAPTEFAGGMMGYSSAPLYEQALAELESRRPGQVAAYDRLFVDPGTGQSNLPAPTPVQTQQPTQYDGEMQRMLAEWRRNEQARNE